MANKVTEKVLVVQNTGKTPVKNTFILHWTLFLQTFLECSDIGTRFTQFTVKLFIITSYYTSPQQTFFICWVTQTASELFSHPCVWYFQQVFPSENTINGLWVMNGFVPHPLLTDHHILCNAIRWITRSYLLFCLWQEHSESPRDLSRIIYQITSLRCTAIKCTSGLDIFNL